MIGKCFDYYFFLFLGQVNQHRFLKSLAKYRLNEYDFVNLCFSKFDFVSFCFYEFDFAQYLCTGFGIACNFLIERTSLNSSFGINRGTAERTWYNLYGWCCFFTVSSIYSDRYLTYNFSIFIQFIYSFIQLRSLLSSKKIEK